MRFRPEQHVRRQNDFRDAREKGRRYECGGFTLWWYRRPASAAASERPAVIALGDPAASVAAPVPVEPGSGLDKVAGPIRGPRVGVIASTAAVGPAVRRNRAKRRLREIFRRHQQLVPPEYDLLLVARTAMNTLAYPAIEKRFVETCQKIFPRPSS